MTTPDKQITVPDGKAASPFAGLTPEELAAHRPRRRLPAQTLILLLILCVSAGSLSWMRREGTKVGIDFTELKVDYTEPDAEKARTYERIMADLARIQTPLDVALTDLGKSPFMLDSGRPVLTDNGELVNTGPSPEERAAAEAAAKAEARRLELIALLQSMKLHSVMGGKVPLARIDDQTVRVGDVLGEFAVTGIDGRVVTLEADGHTFTLSMEAAGPNPKKSPVKMGKPQPRK
jgi:hypothetical protein